MNKKTVLSLIVFVVFISMPLFCQDNAKEEYVYKNVKWNMSSEEVLKALNVNEYDKCWDDDDTGGKHCKPDVDEEYTQYYYFSKDNRLYNIRLFIPFTVNLYPNDVIYFLIKKHGEPTYYRNQELILWELSNVVIKYEYIYNNDFGNRGIVDYYEPSKYQEVLKQELYHY